MNEDNDTIKLFLGDPISDPGEMSFIRRLFRDLGATGVEATLYANFFPPGRNSRQVDLLISTAYRTVHVEIKNLAANYPVMGLLNGPWEQVLPNGDRRSLGKNACRQALGGTFAISDSMRDLARRKAVAASQFKKDIDTVVCCWETIPARSEIETPPFVSVVGYQDLLSRLTTPGPVVRWSKTDWDAFVRHLNLHQPTDNETELVELRSSLEAIADYRFRAEDSLQAPLTPMVQLTATSGESLVSADEIDDLVRHSRRLVAFCGPSGAGKSFLARTLAVKHCQDGHLVIWLRAGDYSEGDFSTLLAKSMSPFSAEHWRSLVRSARASGVPTTVVVDGVNECPSEIRPEMLQQLQAFLLRYPASVLLTSTSAEFIEATPDVEIVYANAPDDEARLALLVAHGARRPELINEQFRTPYELSIAAQCEGELAEDASLADLHDAYIRRFVPAEEGRRGLRVLASHLHHLIRTSMRRVEASSLLNAEEVGLTPSQIDDIMGCALLDVGHQRVRFRHELIGQFLAAEEVVRISQSGTDLGRLLSSPANQPLTETALALLPNPAEISAALTQLGEARRFSSAVSGEFGPHVARIVRELIRDELLEGAAKTESTNYQLVNGDFMLASWVSDQKLTELQIALLTSAGQSMAMGHFVPEICGLLDRTDELCSHQVDLLTLAGSPTPASTVVAATYNQISPANRASPAACHVATGLELRVMGRFQLAVPSGVARSLLATDAVRPWGRLHFAALCIEGEDIEDQMVFTSMLRRAWEVGGYHLKLQALWAARRFRDSDEPHRTEIIDFLEALDADNWGIENTRVEALSAFGAINSGRTVSDIRSEVQAVIKDPTDPASRRSASGIISMQFEDENIVGPYFEAVESLTDRERTLLFTMAVNGVGPAGSMFLDWTITRLSELVPSGDESLDLAIATSLRSLLDGPTVGATMPIEATLACLSAVRCWARLGLPLPAAQTDAGIQRLCWRAIFELLLDVELGATDSEPHAAWQHLQANRPEALQVLSYLDGAASRSFGGETPALHRLLEAHPEQLKLLFEWALDHPEQCLPHLYGRSHFQLRALGLVGDRSTLERLRDFAPDPIAGPAALDAIRQIDRRLSS